MGRWDAQVMLVIKVGFNYLCDVSKQKIVIAGRQFQSYYRYFYFYFSILTAIGGT